jgi:hypothetical protein
MTALAVLPILRAMRSPERSAESSRSRLGTKLAGSFSGLLCGSSLLCLLTRRMDFLG